MASGSKVLRNPFAFSIKGFGVAGVAIITVDAVGALPPLFCFGMLTVSALADKDGFCGAVDDAKYAAGPTDAI